MKIVQKNLNVGLMIILFAIFGLCSTKTNATCQAAFTVSQTVNNVVNFTNTSTGTNINTFYQWSFGDGSYSYVQNPGSHTYSDSGTYVVCLYISDSNSCNSSYCDTIHVYGVLNCNLTVAPTISGSASCGTCADGSAFANASGGTQPYSYLWSPSGGTNNYASGLLPGTYTVLVTDANNCTATGTVTIDTCILHAGFTWTQPSNNVIDFTSTSTGTDTFTVYYYQFGDSTYSWSYYQNNPSHTYSIPGTYYVCLTLLDSNNNNNNCYTTYCDSITVTGVNCSGFTLLITGTDASCNTCANGSAFPIPSGGTAPYSYLWSPSGSTDSTQFGLIPGAYTCCVTDSNGCYACNNVFIGPDSCSAYFTLIQDSNALHTYWAVNYATGAQPLTYNWTWGDSSPMDSMPYPSHVYSTPGYYNICLSITDANGCSSTYCDSSYLQRNSNAMVYVNVINPTTLGIKGIAALNNWSVYPNPVSNTMTINYNLANSSDVKINVYDMLGNKVRSIANEKEAAGQHSINWDASTTPQGIYLLQVIVDNKILNQKITVMK